MAGLIDRLGCYLGTVRESTLGQTQKGFPQAIMRLEADRYYATSAEELKHYGITEPGFVEWDKQQTLAYLVLFNDKGPLLNYDQLQAAFGWSGQDFQDITTFVGKRCLFRVEEDNYNNKISFKVNWIDDEGAPPERTLKAMDPKTVADLNAQFLAGMKKPVAPAKPAVAKAPSVPAPKPSTPSAWTAASPAPAAVAFTAPAGSSKMPAADAFDPPREKKTRKTPPPPAVATAHVGLPAEIDMMGAWEYLNDPAIRGDVDEAKIAEEWQTACGTIGESVPQDKFTLAMWSQVRDYVLKAIGK